MRNGMKRRAFLRNAAGAGVSLGILGGSESRLAGAQTAPASKAPGSAETSFPQVPELTTHTAEFVVNLKLADIPVEALELGKKSILDGLGLALSGSKAETWKLIQEYLKPFGFRPRGGAAVLGSAVRLPARFAAFANGVAIHVDDYDDTQLAAGKDRVYGLLVHPTVCVLPAALATAEVETKSGKDLLVAYHSGVEVESKIAEAISPRHYEDGFHTTGTVGVFGSTTACARLRNFDESQVGRSYGIAASQGAGLRENFGTMMKSFHAGHAAEVGIFSTDLAALGWTGAEQILEADRGFFHAFGRSYDPSAIFHKLAQPWTFANP